MHVKLKEWYSTRGLDYLRIRGKNLLSRYQLSPSKAIHRIDDCLEGLVDQGCVPTFAAPGILVQRYPLFFQHLQQVGAEIAVHGYQHVNLATYSVEEACQQLIKAVNVFKNNGIKASGFRGPYLGHSDELVEALPLGLFEYSSNQAIIWDILNEVDDCDHNLVVGTLHNLYKPKMSRDIISVPWTRPNLIEIPVCLPDDMEYLDGRNLEPNEVSGAWKKILVQIHQRGELFNLIFHPELALLCCQPFIEILAESKQLQPPVWIAKLCDVSQWWQEKAGFKTIVTETITGLRLDFACSSRATILVKGINSPDRLDAWEEPYLRLSGTTIEIPSSPRPLLGLSQQASPKMVSFLEEQGYILDMTETAPKCGIFIDNDLLDTLETEVKIINYIENNPGPLARYWRWPDGAKSALSITGDLDALTLLDYAYRLFVV